MLGEARLISDLVQAVSSRGMQFLGRRPRVRPGDVKNLVNMLLSSRGEASGTMLSRILLDTYAASSDNERSDFLKHLSLSFGANIEWLDEAVAAYRAEPSAMNAATLHEASEPRRQEVLRRLNMASCGTRDLLAMRADLMRFKRDSPELRALDRDFVHIFSSWFNRGFLRLDSISWTTPANILEKIIAYEAVHEISDWMALRGRLEPEDRRCFAFFHPQLPDEPLIFVEVALTTEISSRIETLLDTERVAGRADEATTALFYSISNCQPALAGISFGNLLIKQVVHELRHEFPRLQHFATLSPMPGFADWLAAKRSDCAPWISEDLRSAFDLLDNPDWLEDEAGLRRLHDPLMRAAARYMLEAKDGKGRPVDPVARFHLGNGARVEKLNFMADPSPKGLRQSHAVMVNYVYPLGEIERNHETYAQTKGIAASNTVRRMVPRTNEKTRELGSV